MPSVQIGQEAPDFTLRDDTNQPLTLSSLRGQPVVLVFYPLDFSRICTAETCAYRDDYSAFQVKGARVLGISRDSVWTHKAFKEKDRLTHTLLADMKGEVARLYGCWNEAAAIAERLTVVIDKDGVIRYVEHNPPARSATTRKRSPPSAEWPSAARPWSRAASAAAHVRRAQPNAATCPERAPPRHLAARPGEAAGGRGPCPALQPRAPCSRT